MMQNEPLKQLISKYQEGQCTEEEIALLESWYLQWNETERLCLTEDQLHQARLRSVTAMEPLVEMEPLVGSGRPRKLWPRLAGVAAAVATIVFGVWFFNAQYMNGRHPELVSRSPLANDVAPGKNTATLTLPNGKTINLSDAKTGVVIDAAKLTYNDGTVIPSSLRGGTTKQSHDEVATARAELGSLSRNAPRNDVVVSTPRGGQYQITLPDGTRVWLNADSKISFPAQFIGKERRVLLVKGEAYFEVAKVSRPSLRGGRTKQSFIVESKGQEVEVLGTHFNISAYSDERSTKTTLLEGSVRVSSLRGSTPSLPAPDPSLRGGTTKQSHDEIAASRKAPRNDDRNNDERNNEGRNNEGRNNDEWGNDAGGKSEVLKPGEQAVITANSNHITVKEVNTDDAIAWKNDLFSFNSEEMGSIMRKVARWYDVEISYKDDVRAVKLSGAVPRFSKLSTLLDKLQQTGLASFKIENKKIIVSR
jgi:transmembrane sensor